MSLQVNYELNQKHFPFKNVNFKGDETLAGAPLTEPIDTVRKTIEESVDTFSEKIEEEKNKKSNKKAIAVGSSVAVLTALVAIFNPRYSPKLISKMKDFSYRAGEKIKQSKNNYLASKFHTTCKNIVDWTMRALQFSNNINSAKDIGYKWFCYEKKEFHGVKNKTLRKGLKKINDGFIYVMSRVNESITKGFDKISMRTVQGKYKNANVKLSELDSLIAKVRKNLSPEEQSVLDGKLAEILELRKVFANDSVTQRLVDQEKLMINLERDFLVKFKQYREGFANKWINKGDHIGNNMSFWAEDILMPTRNKFEAEGVEVLDKLFGNSKDKKGLYDDIFDIVSPNLKQEEKNYFSKLIKNADKKARKANYSERVEYFDKKRDLILGSAPTDILTATAGLGLSGVAIATADTREERISNLLTKSFPVVAGLGASMAFTAMLFSGVQGLLYGFITSIILSKIGNLADHYILGNKNSDIAQDMQSIELNKEKKAEVDNV